MSLIQAFLPKNKLTSIESTASDNSTIFLEIDATKLVSHNRSAQVTNFPIETGSSITDHTILSNNRLDLQCVVSGNPFEFVNVAREVFNVQNLKNPISKVEKAKRLVRELGSVGDLVGNNTSRVLNAYRFLTELHKNRNPIQIITDYELYENLIMTSLSIQQTTQTGDVLEFSAQFEQVSFVSNLVLIQQIKKNTQNINDREKAKIGTQVKAKPTKSVEQKGSSVLLKLSSVLGV